MRAFKRHSNRGFTLVELMIVVAIIGVLAVLAMYGVTQYMASTKTAEAKQALGAISRNASEAHGRVIAASQILKPGEQSAISSNGLCASSIAVPLAGPAPKSKYAPNNIPGKDFSSGDETTGWKCLRYEMTDPIAYQYQYLSGTGYVGPGVGGPDPGAAGYEAVARGDLDGDTVLSTFTITAQIDPTTRSLGRSTSIFTFEERE
jgi:type IV pilus assembly protein PilA